MLVIEIGCASRSASRSGGAPIPGCPGPGRFLALTLNETQRAKRRTRWVMLPTYRARRAPKSFLTGVSKMYVCVCNAVSDRTVKRALSEGKHCLRSLREHLGYTARCGRCTGCLREMIDAHLSGLGLPEESAPSGALRETCGG